MYFRAITTTSVLCALTALPALAQDSPDSQDWNFQITPYAWYAGISGTSGTLPPLPPSDLDMSFSDVTDVLDVAGMILAAARNGPWVVFLDTTYVETTQTDPLGGILLEEFETNSKTTTLSLAVGYSVYQDQEINLDAYVGARAWWLETEGTVRTTFGTSRKQSESESWIDPLFGLSARYRFADRWLVYGALEAGGLGVGARSEFSALFGLSYALADWFEIALGYRHISVDYRKNDVIYDVDQSGPVLGGVFRF